MRHAMALAEGVEHLPPVHTQPCLQAPGLVIQACTQGNDGSSRVIFPGMLWLVHGSVAWQCLACMNDLRVPTARLTTNCSCRLKKDHTSSCQCKLASNCQSDNACPNHCNVGVCGGSRRSAAPGHRQ